MIFYYIFFEREANILCRAGCNIIAYETNVHHRHSYRLPEYLPSKAVAVREWGGNGAYLGYCL